MLNSQICYLNSSGLRFCNLAYAFDFCVTGILPLLPSLHTGDTVGLCPGLFQGRDPEADQGRIPHHPFLFDGCWYLLWLCELLLLSYYIEFSDYVLNKLFCYRYLGAHHEMQKIRETICM